MRVALVHDWLVTWRGGEKVLLALSRMFPQAGIYALFHEPGTMPDELERRVAQTSALDSRVLRRHMRFRALLPVLPALVKSLRLPDVDLVISSSHCVAKGVTVPPGARHLSYVHAPLRYMWDRFPDYFGPGRSSPAVRLGARLARPGLQAWDVHSSRGVDHFVANSHHVATQIAARYGRIANVVFPPVELERFGVDDVAGLPRGSYFLCVGALAPYKRIDLAIEAFRVLGLPLKIAGSGQDAWRMKSLPPNVEYLGQVEDAALPALYRDARALVFPGEEDFGLTPVEAQASGRPVIALGRGGATETVTPETGVLFPHADVPSLIDAVNDFVAREDSLSAAACRANAARFSARAFQAGMEREISAVMASR